MKRRKKWNSAADRCRDANEKLHREERTRRNIASLLEALLCPGMDFRVNRMKLNLPKSWNHESKGKKCWRFSCECSNIYKQQGGNESSNDRFRKSRDAFTRKQFPRRAGEETTLKETQPGRNELWSLLLEKCAVNATLYQPTTRVFYSFDDSSASTSERFAPNFATRERASALILSRVMAPSTRSRVPRHL